MITVFYIHSYCFLVIVHTVIVWLCSNVKLDNEKSFDFLHLIFFLNWEIWYLQEPDRFNYVCWQNVNTCTCPDWDFVILYLLIVIWFLFVYTIAIRYLTYFRYFFLQIDKYTFEGFDRYAGIEKMALGERGKCEM